MKNSALFLLFTLAALTCAGQGIFRDWKTIDDNTGKQRSIVSIYEKNGKVYGKIIKLFPAPGDDPDPVCDKCDEEDDRYNKKVLGMVIIRGLQKDGDEYSDGTILDPESGSVYKCKIWLEDNKLMVRGYIGFSLIGRSQSWLPAN